MQHDPMSRLPSPMAPLGDPGNVVLWLDFVIVAWHLTFVKFWNGVKAYSEPKEISKLGSRVYFAERFDN